MLENYSKEFLQKFMLELFKVGPKKEKIEKIEEKVKKIKEIKIIPRRFGVPVIKQKQPMPKKTFLIKQKGKTLEKFSEKDKILKESVLKHKKGVSRTIIKPGISKTSAIDLAKLNPFLKDETVSKIECPGPDKKIKITKDGKVIETETKLNNNEVKDIMKRISSHSKIPLKPIFKVTVANLKINAAVSEIIGSKFIIKKS